MQRLFRAKRQNRRLRAIRLLRDRIRFYLQRQAASTIIMSQDEVIINGVAVKIAKTKKPVTESNTSLYPKGDRANMPKEKLNDILERAVAKSQEKYTMLDLKIDNLDKLEETYDLEMNVSRTRTHHHKYDMHDVFTIVKPDPDVSKFQFVDLYKDYTQVTEAEVAASNEWYATMTADPENLIYRQNLKLTQEHLANNAEDGLVAKIKETYDTYPMEQRGGPLFYKLMMDILQNNSEEATTYLVTTVKNINIQTYEGENINKVVSHIRGAVSRLSNMKTKSGKSALPDDLVESLLKVFQTSSVHAFNSLFEHFSMQTELSSFYNKGATNPTIAQVLSFAEARYRLLCSTKAWTGVIAKTNETSFKACLSENKGETICFNCGGCHSLEKCPKPHNADRIKANKKLFWDERNKKKEMGKDGKSKKDDKKSKKNSKWAPPTKDEKKNKSRRMIDGKEYYYHYKDKRWKLVDKPTTPTSAPTSSPSGNVAEAPAPAAAPLNSIQEVALLNASRQMDSVFRGLMSQFQSGPSSS